MSRKHCLTSERLRELLHYDPETGIFTRKVQAGRYPAGSVSGSIGVNGYVQVWVDGRLYRGHRLAWLFVTGQFPTLQIDHINRDRADNRLQNLRHVTNAQNAENRAKNRSGLPPGVQEKRGKFQAKIKVGSRMTGLGTYFNT